MITSRQPLNRPLLIATGVAGLLGWQVWQTTTEPRQLLLLLIALALGFTLYAASFSFAGAYRALLVHRDTRGAEAHLLMLAAASLLFAPLLARGELFGQMLNGATAPIALMLIVGSFLFGIGMQLGDGCASGTLYTVGGGSRRMLLTLTGFMAGSVIGSLHLPFWWRQPSWGTYTLNELAGSWPAALFAQLALLGVLYLLLRRWRRPVNEPRPADRWPLWLGALLLALLNLAVLLGAGHPWSIAWGYTLWGGKLAQAGGLDLSSSLFWGSGYPAWALKHNPLGDTTAMMNVGIIVGASLAATRRRAFPAKHTPDIRQTLAALIGGLLMGYGARLAFGCNIGSFFSGVASFSLHGWLWIVCALLGTLVGIRLRPLFGMSNG